MDEERLDNLRMKKTRRENGTNTPGSRSDHSNQDSPSCFVNITQPLGDLSSEQPLHSASNTPGCCEESAAVGFGARAGPRHSKLICRSTKAGSALI